MNFRQMHYVVILAETLNFSQAADKLGITQPALSKQIISIENELGITLFNRSSVPFTLTSAGEEIVAHSKEMLRKEAELKKIADDYKSGNKGRLVIGISPFRATYFLTDVIKTLQKHFSGLEIVLKETNSNELHKLAVEGKVDLAIINLPFDDTQLDVIPLHEEKLVLVVPQELDEQLKSRGIANPTIKDVEKFPFITVSKSQELRRMFDRLCAMSEVKPQIAVEVNGIATVWALASSGIGIAVVPLNYAQRTKTKNVTLYELGTLDSIRRTTIVTQKGGHLTKYAAEAIRLIKNI